MQQQLGLEPVFPTLEDFVERSSALIGSPQQVIEKVHRYHEQFGHSVMHLHADAGGLHRAAASRLDRVVPSRNRAGPAPGDPGPAMAWGPVASKPPPGPRLLAGLRRDSKRH